MTLTTQPAPHTAAALTTPMKIGILQFELIIDGSTSLKDKRRVVRSLKDSLHRHHQVSVAEVDTQDILNLATLGLACVNADTDYLAALLDRILARLRIHPDARLADYQRRIIDLDDINAGLLNDDGTPLWTEDERRDEDPAPPAPIVDGPE